MRDPRANWEGLQWESDAMAKSFDSIPLDTGSSWTMGVFSAICALASADYTRVSALSASCGRGGATRWC